MNCHGTVVDFALVSIPLARGTHSLLAALAGTGLVNTTNCLTVCMVFRDDLLASIS
jgi:hypothetical protein